MATMTMFRIRFGFFVQSRSFLAYFPYESLRDLLPVCISPPNNFRMPEPVFIKLGMYVYNGT
jgi:hypothetical protein